MEISGSAFNSGLSTIQSGQRRVDQAAADIASNTVSSSATPQPAAQPPATQPQATEQGYRPDLAESLVSLNIGKVEVQAGARVVDTADEVLGTLIDTRA
ncbi:hypothetical protein [Aquipseudomonas campi]